MAKETKQKRRTIASWKLNARGERLRVRLDRFQGHDLISIRVWYRASDGELKPSNRGISLGANQLPALAQGLRKACKVARKRGLIA